MAIGLQTYQDSTRREDLMGFVSNISPTETPLLTGLKKVKASNTLHEYLLDTFAAAADNANAESKAFATADHTQPTRLNNTTQIFYDPVEVSSTELAVSVAGGDPLKYQIAKNMKEHAKDRLKSSMSLKNLAKSVKAKAFDRLARMVLPFVCYANTEERLAI